MDPNEYKAIYTFEDEHWWYIGLRELVFRDISLFSRGKKGTALDGGCGAGAVLKRLSEDYKAVGIDYSPIALGFCRERGLKTLVRASVTELPFADKSFDIVTSLDVIYHAAVKDDMDALREFRRVLKDNGILILNLPAYEFLRSPHDLANYTQRRYTRNGLAKKLISAGYRIEKISYRNAFLFPIIASVRFWKKWFSKPDNGSSGSDLRKPPPLVNEVLILIIKIENMIMRRFSLPFGSSVFCVARKIA